MILSHIAEVFEDEQVVFIELLDGTFQRQGLPSLLQALHKIGGSGEQDPVAVLDERMTEGGAEVRLSRSAGAEQQDRAASVDPSVAGGVWDFRPEAVDAGGLPLSNQEAAAADCGRNREGREERELGPFIPSTLEGRALPRGQPGAAVPTYLSNDAQNHFLNCGSIST